MQFVNKSYLFFLKTNEIKRYSPFSSNGAVFADWFRTSFRFLLGKPVFDEGNLNWMDEIESVRKENKNTKATQDQSKNLQKNKEMFSKLCKTEQRN